MTSWLIYKSSYIVLSVLDWTPAVPYVFSGIKKVQLTKKVFQKIHLHEMSFVESLTSVLETRNKIDPRNWAGS